MAIYLVSENLLGIEAHQIGKGGEPSGTGSFFGKIKGVKVPKYVNGHFTKLTKGHNILLKGAPTDDVVEVKATTFAIQPKNFNGMSPIPKVVVNEGDEVLAGQELFFDKKRPEIKYMSPVSGEVMSIKRGEKRAITEVVILADKVQKYREIPAIDLDKVSRDNLVQFLLDCGGWTMIRQRPYDIIAEHNVVPDNIFISTFDTAPLAPNPAVLIKGQENHFQTGVKLLSKLTNGRVHIGLDANGESAPPSVFVNVADAEKHWFAGPHPSGNVGVQIHHTKPISSKDQVWILGIQEVLTLGKLINDRKYDVSRIVAVGGQVLSHPRHVRTKLGAKLNDILDGQGIKEDDRIISGDVLSGKAKLQDGFLNYFDDQISVIPEGKEFELFGWLLPLKMRPSISRTFPGFLFKEMQYSVNTNTHGEGRAFVMTGQYEDMLPMNIYPQHLMKAILTKDFEKMEGLGILELSEEDVALCEFACTSKQPLQHILRSGLEIMQEQG
ncbi:MAG: Na(+)-translocating NADH-quinone reductase subunit A [Saprospiraceae bacterium]|nr:Na(+)-translocating NADH-quinone reductase subunit A [Saprospiraceae bacterium]